MTTLKEILAKDISRDIDGVIKAEDERHLVQEVEEYVITKEIAKELRKLVEALKDATSEKGNYPYNGVWISGYFGSGKSHLLKILSLIMGNKTVQGIKLKDIFLKKIDDALFRADFENILDIPATSILFNIEQHAESARNMSDNAVLYAFIRMFNKMRGYYIEPGAVSRFEQHLDEENRLESWKNYYHEKTGKSWDENRSKALMLGRKTFISVLGQFHEVSTEEAERIISQYESQYSITVDSFTKEVAHWLDRQPDKRHRINFFVDEVGQFVAQDSRLMLSLQTIVESLGVETGGRAWVYVTSQETIDTLVDTLKRNSAADAFSKILGRFKFRIALSSADVQEVIQKRLLEKKEKGKELLGEFYHREKESLRTVFTFTEGGKAVQFKDEETFIYSYPFPAYQYTLLQDALKGLGEHDAFVGAHVSRGERSMLEIFQDVGKSYQNKELYRFAPFDAMFDGIRQTLKTGLIAAINQAERNLADDFSVRVIKALLLVKYIQGFKSTVNNIKILLADRIDLDLVALEQQVQESLNKLENQTYIRRNGDIYEYLTDDERDVEDEIRRINAEDQECRKFIEGIVFGDILKGSKIRHIATGEDYAFQKAMDDEPARGQGDLILRVVSPWHPDAENRSALLTRSMGRKELLIILPLDTNFINELELFLKTEAWIRRTDAKQTKYARIYADKQAQNNERKRRLADMVRELIKVSDFAVMDQELSIPNNNPLERIERAFQDLVSRSYPNLKLLKTHYTQESLRKILYDSANVLELGGVDSNEAEQELHNWLKRKQAQMESVSLAAIKEEFSKGQYGWYEWAILCIIASLFKREEIELLRGTEVLGMDDVYNLLNQNRGHDAVTIKLTPVVTGEMVRKLKDIHETLFHIPNSGSSGKDAAIAFKDALLTFIQDFEQSLSGAPDFAFCERASELNHQLRNMLKNDWSWFLENLDSYRTNLENMVDEADHIIKFLKGPNVETWRRIDTWLHDSQDNLAEIAMPDAERAIKAYRTAKDLYETSDTKRAKDLWETMVQKEQNLLAEERKQAEQRIDEYLGKLTALPEWTLLSQEQQQEFRSLFTRLKDSVKMKNTLPAIRDVGITQAGKVYESCRTRINEILHPAQKIIYADAKEKRVPFHKTELVSEADVKDYAMSLEEHWKKLIAQGKRISL